MTFTPRNDVQDDSVHCFSLWRSLSRPPCRSERALRGLVHPLRRVARPARLCTEPPPSATSTAPFRPLGPHLDTAAVHDDGEARGGRRERIASAAKHGEQVVGQPHLRYWLYSRSRRPRRGGGELLTQAREAARGGSARGCARGAGRAAAREAAREAAGKAAAAGRALTRGRTPTW